MFARSIAIAGVLFLVSTALAQRMPFQTTPRGYLAMMPDVRKELKITKEQSKKIDEALKEMQAAGQSGNLAGFDLMNPMASLDPKILAILDDAQRLRLDELFLQANLGFALADPKFAEAFALTDEQKAAAKAIDQECKSAMMPLMMNMRSNKDIDKARAARKEFGDKLLALLTSEQAAKMPILQGKPFKFKDK